MLISSIEMSMIQYEIFRTVVFVLLYVFITFAIAKALWLVGLRGKASQFNKLWGAVSLFIAGIMGAVGFFILMRTL